MQHVSWHHINKMSKAGGEQAVNDPGWWSSPKGMECETHHNRFTREKIHVRVVRRALACHARLKVKALT